MKYLLLLRFALWRYINIQTEGQNKLHTKFLNFCIFQYFNVKLSGDCRESSEPAPMRPPRGPAAVPPPSSSPPPMSTSASAAAPFSRYAALLSLGDGGGDLAVRDAVDAAGERVGWANLGSNSWRSDGGLFADCSSSIEHCT